MSSNLLKLLKQPQHKRSQLAPLRLKTYPDPLMILNVLVRLARKPEAMRAGAVLVVHHLGVVAVPADVGSGLELIVAVL